MENYFLKSFVCGLFLSFFAFSKTPLKNTGPLKALPIEVLREISNAEDPSVVEKKYDEEIKKVLNGVEIVNSISSGMKETDFETDKESGVQRAVRVCSWNIRRSENVKQIIAYLESPDKFEDTIPKGFSRKEVRAAWKQYEKFKNCDILLLQEMLVGTQETAYKNPVAMLAESLGMNYSFAPSQIERDPRIIGENSGVDAQAYQGLFGTAVLTRSKIIHAENKQFAHQPYDWSEDEAKKLPNLEKLRRVGAKVLLKEEQRREVKTGGRGIHLVDIHMPEAKNETMTLLNVHLEVKTNPSGRRKQLLEILERIKDIDNPIVVAGDFNSTQSDVSPLSVERAVKEALNNPETFIDWAISNGLSNGMIVGYLVKYIRYFKNWNNPFSPNIPILAANKQKAMFNDIERHTHSGWCFDSEGSPGHSYVGRIPRLRKEQKIPIIGEVLNRQHHAGNSNQRSMIPFREVGTFRTNRTIGSFGHERLDFAAMTYPCDQDKNDYFMRPQLGEIFAYTNGGYNGFLGKTKGTDHHPISFVFSTKRGPNQPEDEAEKPRARAVPLAKKPYKPESDAGIFKKKQAPQLFKRSGKGLGRLFHKR